MAASILVVEDNPDMHYLLRPVLDPLGSVSYVRSGEEAEALLRKSHYDLVLSDQELDGKMTGIDLYLACRKRYPGTAFLLISAFPGNVFQKLLATGIECPPYVDKPFTTPQIRNSVQQILSLAAASRKTHQAA